jgi:hypothetical protein
MIMGIISGVLKFIKETFDFDIVKKKHGWEKNVQISQKLLVIVIWSFLQQVFFNVLH